MRNRERKKRKQGREQVAERGRESIQEIGKKLKTRVRDREREIIAKREST